MAKAKMGQWSKSKKLSREFKDLIDDLPVVTVGELDGWPDEQVVKVAERMVERLDEVKAAVKKFIDQHKGGS